METANRPANARCLNRLTIRVAWVARTGRNTLVRALNGTAELLKRYWTTAARRNHSSRRQQRLLFIGATTLQ